MIKTHYPTQPYPMMPEPPFVQIGVSVNHYSTGSVYTHIYSDDPKSDIPEYLMKSSFELSWSFAPIIVRNGVACRIKPRKISANSYWECLLVPVEDVRIDIGCRSIILAADEYYQMTLERLANA